MPIVNPDKLIAVLLCAALALSCYPMPVRAWADEGAGDEVVSEGSSGSFDGFVSVDGVSSASMDDGDSPDLLSSSEPDNADSSSSAGSGASGVSVGDSPFGSGLQDDFEDRRDGSAEAQAEGFQGDEEDSSEQVVESSSNPYFSYSRDSLFEVLSFYSSLGDLSEEQEDDFFLASTAWESLGYGAGVSTLAIGPRLDAQVKAGLSALGIGYLSSTVEAYNDVVDSTGYELIYNSIIQTHMLDGLVRNVANIYSRLGSLNTALSNIYSRLATTNDYLFYSGRSAAHILYELWDDLEYTSGNTVYSAARMLYGIWDDLEKDGYSVADFLAAIDTNLHSNGYGAARLLYEVWDDLEYSVSGKSYSVAHSAYGIWEDVEILDGHVVSNGSLISKGISDVYGALRASVDGGVLSAAQILGHIRGRLGADRDGVTYGLGSLASMTYDRLVTVDGRLHTSVDGGDLSAAQILGHIRGRLGADRNGVTYGLGSLASMTYDRLVTVDGKLSLGDNGSVVSVAGFAQQIRNRLQYVSGNNTYTAAGLLYRIWQAGISDSSLVSKGFSDVIAALDTREVVITGDLQLGDVTVDNSGIEDRLDTIAGLLLLAGAKDLLSDFLGDFTQIDFAPSVSSVQAAMAQVFPFCIPMLFNQVLGLLSFDGSAPVFEFDIAGAPLVLDFSAAEDFAAISRWVTSVSFALFLLANTKRFIFTLSKEV